ncbi:MAG: hypothetical protein MNPFHGCM_01282 [Gemmatimonadaceae bacterium]|nr:hypothetical protein [Gemmatimonadaceae bacterium]
MQPSPPVILTKRIAETSRTASREPILAARVRKMRDADRATSLAGSY